MSVLKNDSGDQQMTVDVHQVGSAIKVKLAGGLGNQLFQLSRALAFRRDYQHLVIETSYLESNAKAKRFADITDYNLGVNSTAISNRIPKFENRLFNFALRISSIAKGGKAVEYLIAILNTLLLISYKARFLKNRYFIASGLGYSLREPQEGNVCFIGYFQSYKWATSEKVHSFLQNLELKEPFPDFLMYSSRSVQKSPIVVHMRMGDYRNEKDFGIPSNSYYVSSVDELWASGKYGEIWLFSDEPEEAIKRLPERLREKSFVFENISLSPAQTLECMRLGHAYVLSNSTFGWWGAFLTKNHGATVIYPKPWFVNKITPTEICPPNWHSRDR